MIASDMHPGDPLHWQEREPVTNEIKDYYGVVVKGRDGGIACVPVYALYSDNKHYNEGGAKWEKHRDNVLLAHCPPPFSALRVEVKNGNSARGVYAYADMNHPIEINSAFMSNPTLNKPDRGCPVHFEDMKQIYDHPWRDEKERGLDGDKPVEPEYASDIDLDDGRDDEIASLIGSVSVDADAMSEPDWRGFNKTAPDVPVSSPIPASVRKVFEMAGRNGFANERGKDIEFGS